MLTITLTYLCQRNRQKLSQQSAALQSVVLEAPGELDFLRLLEVTRTVTSIPTGLQFDVVYNTLPAAGDLPAFETLYPTPDTQQGAVQNLWTDRLDKALYAHTTQTAVLIV